MVAHEDVIRGLHLFFGMRFVDNAFLACDLGITLNLFFFAAATSSVLFSSYALYYDILVVVLREESNARAWTTTGYKC